MVYKQAIISCGAGWSGKQEVGSRQALGTTPDVPETMQSLPGIPVSRPHWFILCIAFLVVAAQHFIMKVFDHSIKLKDTILFF